MKVTLLCFFQLEFQRQFTSVKAVIQMYFDCSCVLYFAIKPMYLYMSLESSWTQNNKMTYLFQWLSDFAN